MINELSEKIANRLLRKKIIDNEEKEIYQYGMNQMLLSLINILTTLMIGILLGMLWQCVIFTFSFMVIRLSCINAKEVLFINCINYYSNAFSNKIC